MKTTENITGRRLCGALIGALLGLALWVLLFATVLKTGRITTYLQPFLATVFGLLGYRLAVGFLHTDGYFLCPLFGWILSVVAVYATFVKEIQTELSFDMLTVSFLKALTISFEFFSGNNPDRVSLLLHMIADFGICLAVAAVTSFLTWVFWPDAKPQAETTDR